eukprot:PhF_6_TR8264/c0_g1_i1/m.12592
MYKPRHAPVHFHPSTSTGATLETTLCYVSLPFDPMVPLVCTPLLRRNALTHSHSFVQQTMLGMKTLRCSSVVTLHSTPWVPMTLVNWGDPWSLPQGQRLVAPQ